MELPMWKEDIVAVQRRLEYELTAQGGEKSKRNIWKAIDNKPSRLVPKVVTEREEEKFSS